MSKIEVNTVAPQCGTTLTLGESGDTVTLGSGASQSGFGRAGSVDWQTSIKTTGFTAVSGEGYFCNTTGGAFTVTLPSSPSAGDIVALKDYANTWDSNNLTVGRNSSNIGGEAQDSVLALEGLAVTLVYADATKGWLVTESGLQNEAPGPEFISATGGTITTVCTNFKVHTFTSPGTFTVCSAGNSGGSNTVSYMVIAGGGGGGYYTPAGGAGGYRESKAITDTYTASPLNATSGAFYNLPVTAQGYPITVGGGGNGGGPPDSDGTKGSDSIFSTVTATGGGYGAGGPATSNSSRTGGPGGSGGVGAPKVPSGGWTPGSGNTPPVSPPQGNDGGTSHHEPGVYQLGGGGGGAGGVGGSVSPAGPGATSAASGGAGTTSSINGTPTVRASGGSGGSDNTPRPGGAATPGGGGAGGGPSQSGGAGTANTGGGGGGSGSGSVTSGNGGSGIVIIRYKFQ